jgi:hypothetical protein
MQFRLERLASWYLRRRGIVVLPREWRGIAVGGPDTLATCDDYDNTKPSAFTVYLGPRSQLVAVNFSQINCQKASIDLRVDMGGAHAG